MTPLRHDINLDIATADSSGASRWKNTHSSWAGIATTLSETTRTEETVKQYFSFGKDKQDSIKDVGGFVGGKLLGGVAKIKGVDVTYKPPYGWRRKGYVEYRQIVALDVDYGDLDTWLDFMNLSCAGLMYTTHKHQRSSARFRIVFPLDRQVSPDEYEAIARKVASWLDIEVFDDSTYQPTRLMYYPSTAKDGEYIFHIVDEPILSADETLASYDDWTNVNEWPTSSRENEIRQHGSTVADPDAKDGVVGAFCRSFTITEAIAEFLSDVYAPCEELGPDRYTFLGGSTSGGLLVYEDKHAYSNHGTDPASRKLCNAYDLVRLHKFGDLDNGKEYEEVVKAPSYKAMSEFATGLKEVKREIVRARRDNAVAAYDELDQHARNVAYNDEWVGTLEMTGKGDKARIDDTRNNLIIILSNDENLRACFAFDRFEQREIALRALPWDKHVPKYPRPLTDADDAQLRTYLEHAYKLTTQVKITDALAVVVHDNSVHPVKDYLDACVWDGVERLDTLLIDLFGAEDTPYVRAVTRKIICGAVARIYTPGCYLDYAAVLLGDEGKGKSKFLRTLFRGWFTDSVPALGNNKEALEAIQGAWCVELGEMDSVNRSDADTVKLFIAKVEDRFRVAYGKRLSFFPRTCVFIGTGNKPNFLKSVNGNRRWWVVNFLGREGTLWWETYLTEVVISQLWGEARQRLTDGELLYLDKELEAEARSIQDDHLEIDERAGIITEYLDTLLPDGWVKWTTPQRCIWLSDEDNKDKGTEIRTQVSVMEIWAECLNENPAKLNPRDSTNIGRILRSLRGWTSDKPIRQMNYGIQRVYVRAGFAAIGLKGTRPAKRA